MTMRCFRETTVDVGSITYSECLFVALDIQHAMRMCRIICLWPAQHYTILPHSPKRHNFRNKITEHKSVLISCTTLSETPVVLRRIQCNIITNVRTLVLVCSAHSCCLSDWNETLNFRHRASSI